MPPAPPTPTPKRQRLTLAIASLTLTLTLTEITLHLTGFNPMGELGRDGRGVVVRPSADPLLEYELTPGASARAWRTDVRVNAQGFRDDELAAERAPLRIVALGDSVTFGISLPLESTWPQQLEQALNREDRVAEVVNMGVTGYDTVQEWRHFERNGARLAPDVVVVQYHLNDAGAMAPLRSQIERLRTYSSPLYRSRLAQFVRVRLDRLEAKDAFARRTEMEFAEHNAEFIADLSEDPDTLLRIESIAALARELDSDGPDHTYAAWYGSPARIGRLRWAFGQLNATCRAAGAEPWLFICPWLGEADVPHVYDEIYALVEAEAQRAGLRVVSMVTPMRAVSSERLRINGVDRGHPNELGHRIFARMLRDELIATGRVQG